MKAGNIIQLKTEDSSNKFYRDHYHQIILGLIALLAVLILAICFVFYQLLARPLPGFQALQPNGERKELTPFTQPNLLADTILRWASKAATISYTYDFVNYTKQKQMAKPFFTEEGWRDYERSINTLINTIITNKLIVNGVVAGVPLISNQGELPEKGYSWRVQIPFIVTFQSADTLRRQNYQVTLTIVQIPTTVNPQGIGIDQFVMR